MVRVHAEDDARLKSLRDDGHYYIIHDCPRCAVAECPHLFVACGATRAQAARLQGDTVLVCYVGGRAVVTDDGTPITENVMQALADRR